MEEEIKNYIDLKFHNLETHLLDVLGNIRMEYDRYFKLAEEHNKKYYFLTNLKENIEEIVDDIINTKIEKADRYIAKNLAKRIIDRCMDDY